MSSVELEQLRRRPAEWHRRGLWHPDEVEAMVHTRLMQNLPTDPSYSDFFDASYRR